MDDLLTDPTPANKAISLKQGDFIASKLAGLTASQEFFHDLSATSVGLLTNTATGGWRKDFSLLSENWSAQPTSGLPLFQVKPGENLDFTRPNTSNPTRARSIFYPWSGYRGVASDPVIYKHGAVSSWENLMNWATLYKTMGANGTTIPTQSTRIDPTTAAESYNFLHKVRVIPLIARIQWVFSYAAVPGTPASTPARFTPRLLVTPVVTLWNPYNVEIKSSPKLQFWLGGTLPNAFKFNVPGFTTKLTSVMKSANYPNPLTASTAADTLKCRIDGSYTLKPGETLLFSPNAPNTWATAANAWQTELIMTPGFRAKGGHLFPLRKTDGTEITNVPGTAIVSTGEARFDAQDQDTYNQPSHNGVGISFDMNIPTPSGSSTLARHLVYRSLYDSAIASQVYKPIQSIDIATATLSEVNNSPKPFLTTIFGARSASTSYIPAKGFVQSSPWSITRPWAKKPKSKGDQIQLCRSPHPVNSPFDYDVKHPLRDLTASFPNTDRTNRGYIVSGFTSQRRTYPLCHRRATHQTGPIACRVAKLGSAL